MGSSTYDILCEVTTSDFNFFSEYSFFMHNYNESECLPHTFNVLGSLGHWHYWTKCVVWLNNSNHIKQNFTVTYLSAPQLSQFLLPIVLWLFPFHTYIIHSMAFSLWVVYDRGNPWVFFSYPYLYPPKPLTLLKDKGSNG